MRNIVCWAAASAFLLGCRATPSTPNFDYSQTSQAWNDANDPARLKDAYEVHFDVLPVIAELEQKPWTDTYWPNNQGGLADRWHHPDAPDAFTYPLNDATAVAAMDETGLSQLSPAEKYDVFLGRYDYPLVSRERSRTKPTDLSWYGLCHGWAAAALNFKEPKPVVVESAAGVRVPFGSSDIKALLIYAQASRISDSRIVGRRCNSNTGGGNECQDINAGSFHIILANQIALLKAGFIVEVSRTSQIWNHPVFGFASEKVGETDQIYASAAPDTVKIVQVKTILRYIAEKGPSWEPLPFLDFPDQERMAEFDYTLELNAEGEILGGEWISTEHPDFVWTQAAPQLDGYFKEAGRIYEASVAQP